MFAVPYPSHIKKRKLGYLADKHNGSISFKHRALFNVLARCKHTQNITGLVRYKKYEKAKFTGLYFDLNIKNGRKKIKEYQYKTSNFNFDRTE